VEPFQASYRKTFSGLALLIVRPENGKPGRIRVTATSAGLQSGETLIDAK
jgi:hypothetical protein